MSGRDLRQIAALIPIPILPSGQPAKPFITIGHRTGGPTRYEVRFEGADGYVASFERPRDACRLAALLDRTPW